MISFSFPSSDGRIDELVNMTPEEGGKIYAFLLAYNLFHVFNSGFTCREM